MPPEVHAPLIVPFFFFLLNSLQEGFSPWLNIYISIDE
jgi:hypothetical protein